MKTIRVELAYEMKIPDEWSVESLRMDESNELCTGEYYYVPAIAFTKKKKVKMGDRNLTIIPPRSRRSWRMLEGYVTSISKSKFTKV